MLARMTDRTADRNAAEPMSATTVVTVAEMRALSARISGSASRKKCATAFAVIRESASTTMTTKRSFSKAMPR